MSKSKVKVIITMIVVLAALLTYATLCDMELSNKIYQGEDNMVALLGGFLGKVPAFFLLGVCFAILLTYVRLNKSSYRDWLAILLYILYIGAIFVAFLLCFYSAFEELTSKAKYLGLICGALATCIAVLLSFKKDIGHMEELKKWAIVTIIGICVLIITTLILKKCWGRARYIDIITSGATFTKWMSPQGFTGGSSFPSGHTALWGALYFVLPLFAIMGYKGEGIAFFFVLATQLLIGAFRIIGGHHFLSDVSVSIFLSFTIAYVTDLIAYNSTHSNKELSPKNIFRYI